MWTCWLLYGTMLLHTAWLRNGQLISDGAGTPWKMTLVKEGPPLSPLKKSSTKSMTCCPQVGMWLNVLLRHSWAPPRNVFMQLSTTNLKWWRSQLDGSQNFLDLIRSGFNATCQRTFLPFFKLIQNGFIRRFVSMNETWIHLFQPELKEQ